MQRKRKALAGLGDDLFSAEPGTFIKLGLSRLAWPPQGRFPVNHHQARVGDVVIRDLTSSERPLLIAGYSSIGALIEQVADWHGARIDSSGSIRLLLGSEPFPSRRTYFGSPESKFTEEVYEYWQEHSVSVRLSAKIIRALELLDGGSLKVRVIPGPTHLHAKAYIGDSAATVGSSNFTEVEHGGSSLTMMSNSSHGAPPVV